MLAKITSIHLLVGSISMLHTACTIVIKPAFAFKERKFCLQSTVDAPYLYLLALSARSDTLCAN